MRAVEMSAAARSWIRFVALRISTKTSRSCGPRGTSTVLRAGAKRSSSSRGSEPFGNVLSPRVGRSSDRFHSLELRV
jgi:hypothetical protein